MSTSKSIKDVILVFLHIGCILLCAWYGIKSLTVFQVQKDTLEIEVNHKKIQKVAVNQTLISSGATSIVFAFLSGLNLALYITSKCLSKKNPALEIAVASATIGLVIVGCILVVLLGQASIVLDTFESVDMGLIAVVIAFVLICILIQVSTLNMSRACLVEHWKKIRYNHEPVVESEFFVSPHRQKPPTNSDGKVARPVELSFVNHYASYNPLNSENSDIYKINNFSPTATIHRSQVLPTLQISASDLDTAKKKLRKSSTSSHDSTPTRSKVKRLPTLLEENTRSSFSRIERTNDFPRVVSNFSADYSVFSGEDDVFFRESGFNTPNQSVPLSLRRATLPDSFENENLSINFLQTSKSKKGSGSSNSSRPRSVHCLSTQSFSSPNLQMRRNTLSQGFKSNEQETKF